MDKKNPIYQKDYPEWKKNLWGIFRAFVGSFIPVFGALLTTVTVEHFQDKEVLIKLGVSILIASLTAGIVGVGKFLRDLCPQSEIVQRLPF